MVRVAAAGRPRKLGQQVVFPEMLDLSPFLVRHAQPQADCAAPAACAPCTRYRLYGVVEHQGSMGGGHYVAHINTARGTPAGGGAADAAATAPAGGDAVANATAARAASAPPPQWWHASDRSVSSGRQTANGVPRCQAYIMFYERFP